MTAIAQHPHRVTTAVADARTQLSDVAGASLLSMNVVDTAATLGQIKAAKAQLAELEARVLVHADQIAAPDENGAADIANWYAITTCTSKLTAHRTMRLAHGLEAHEPTRIALATGAVHAEQAHVILNALTELPEDLDPKTAVAAEQHLLDLARDFDAKSLHRLAKHVLHVVAPEIADAHEAKALERQEREAEASSRLTMWEDGHGRVHGRFTLDQLTGTMLKRGLWALAAPKHRASKGPLDERRPTPERLGQAFAEYISRYPAKKLPRAGGINATVIVTMQLETLLGGLKAAHLDTGEPISPGLARRLACEAGIIPQVLGTRSEVLDQGYQSRFFKPGQRIAKQSQTKTCEIDSCDMPVWATHAHHRKRWADKGTTNLDDAIMVCPWHHSRAHDSRYDLNKLPTGTYTFHRRT